MTQRDNGGEYEFLDWLGIRNAPNWGAASVLGKLVGTILVIFVPLLFLGAIGVSGLVLFSTAKTALIGGAAGGINLGAGALIAALLGAPFVIWGTWLKYQTVRYQKEGHMTDRINKAVEMLGAEKTVKKLKKDKSGSVEVTAPNIEVRIGAILSLERIAQDSTAHDKGRDHVRVMEILCAYVRENTKVRPAAKFIGDTTILTSLLDWTSNLPPLRQDIQISLGVLGKRSLDQIAIEKAHIFGNSHYKLDLTGANLQGARLDGYNFSSACLRDAALDGAWINRANFSDANLLGLSAIGVSARAANFERANLGADFTEAVLDEAQFEFVESDERFSSFNGRFAKFAHAQLIEARFKFRRTTQKEIGWVSGADFSSAIMYGCIFDGLNQYHEQRWPEQIPNKPSHELGLVFRNCDLTRRFLRICALDSCFGDGSTNLPPNIARPDHWPEAKLDTKTFQIEMKKWRANRRAYIPPTKRVAG